jgi:hypothetical protein
MISRMGVKMNNILENHSGFTNEPQVTDRSAYLWLEQNLMKLQAKSILQEEVLDKVVAQAKGN